MITPERRPREFFVPDPQTTIRITTGGGVEITVKPTRDPDKPEVRIGHIPPEQLGKRQLTFQLQTATSKCYADYVNWQSRAHEESEEAAGFKDQLQIGLGELLSKMLTWRDSRLTNRELERIIEAVIRENPLAVASKMGELPVVAQRFLHTINEEVRKVYRREVS